MSMRTLGVTAFYRAPVGGLQENIRAAALYARRRGWRVRLALPDGPFLNSLRDARFETLAVDFTDRLDIEAAANFLAVSDLVHFHPGSRTVALRASELSAAPLVYTVHGSWHDGLPTYASHLSCIISVSDAVHELVARSIGANQCRSIVIPNGVDLSLFMSRELAQPRILIASRLDTDKAKLIDLVIALWGCRLRMAKNVWNGWSPARGLNSHG